MTKRNIKIKSQLAKWLLITTLFAGRFGFNRSAGPSSFQQQKAQTEYVFSNKVKAGYRIADYQLPVVQYHTLLKCIDVRYSNAILVYGRISKVQFDQRLRQPVFNTTYYLLRHVKTIPQSSGEDPDVFLMG